MNLVLFDRKPELVREWCAAFYPDPFEQYQDDSRRVDVTVRQVEDLAEVADSEFDAVVSPANSYGVMDGGIDLAYRKRYGLQLQRRVQATLRSEGHRGEQPVGTAIVVPLSGYVEAPYLIHAPTMRVPQDVSRTSNVYNATRAILRAADAVTGIETVYCPGLGTGTGKVSPRSCALQMALAVEQYLRPDYPIPTWVDHIRWEERIQDAVRA